MSTNQTFPWAEKAFPHIGLLLEYFNEILLRRPLCIHNARPPVQNEELKPFQCFPPEVNPLSIGMLPEAVQSIFDSGFNEIVQMIVARGRKEQHSAHGLAV